LTILVPSYKASLTILVPSYKASLTILVPSYKIHNALLSVACISGADICATLNIRFTDLFNNTK
jgi:hypothetical protein